MHPEIISYYNFDATFLLNLPAKRN